MAGKPIAAEPLGSLGLDFQKFERTVSAVVNDFLQTVQVFGPAGELPRTLKVLLIADLYALLIFFTRADKQVSDNRIRILLSIHGWLEGRIYTPLPTGEPLNKFRADCQRQWNTVGFGEPSSVTLLQAYDHTFDTKHADQAKKLFRRLAGSFSNADGPPSQESKRIFEDYEKLLGEVDSSLEEPIQKAPLDQSSTSSQFTSTALAPSLEPLLTELSSLVGLQQVKQDVTELANYIKVQQMRQTRGMKTPIVSLPMVFHGNPGTGKTTVARLLSKIYNALGVVSKGQLIETDRSGLVAGYVGQTALKVKSVAEKALGGILFIDEAYALKRGEDQQDFGNEAIETLLKFMEDNRRDLVVIVAGYPAEMKRFLDANPGLQSRFNKCLTFTDYPPEELMEIFVRFCAESDYELSETAHAGLMSFFRSAYKNRDFKFGNARLVRNIFEKTTINLANRVVQDLHGDRSTLELIQYSDIIAATSETASFT
jgi:stage V sporulation protein K